MTKGDDDKPKRLSLRERMALRGGDGEEETTIITTTTTTDTQLKKYRQSREVSEKEAIEKSTTRKVIRLDENGNEEVTVRERHLINTDEEQVKREVSRKSKNYESLPEEDETPSNDKNNNKRNAEITIEPQEKTIEQRRQERAERRASRRKESDTPPSSVEKTVTVQTSISTTDNGVENVKTTRTSRFSRGSTKESEKVEQKTVEVKMEAKPVKMEAKEIKVETKVEAKPEELKKEEPKKVIEEKIEVKEEKTVESAKVEEPAKVEETRRSSKVEEAPKNEVKDKLSSLKKNQFESNKGNSRNRPGSMVDFKSKFENKSNTNAVNKRPVSMNIKSKFEQDTKPANKFELRKTTSVPLKPSALKTSTNKVESDKNGVHTEKTVTKTDATIGEGASKKEVKEIKSVETKDTATTHAEKTTTITETKTKGGSTTVTKTETKMESTRPALKKTSTTKSVEERMKERKQQQANAKKNSTAGRNAFKLKLEANAQPVNFSIKSPKSPGGSMMASLSTPKTPTSGDSNIDKLLKWIAKRINQYPAVNVTNFTSSWADGIALCALMNYLLGDEAIDPLAVFPDDRKKNFELAIACATKAGVPALLDAGEMAACPEVDRRSMITYLHTVYKVLWHDKQEKK
ncbi:calponin homology domain-containing protein DDB_G0272472-like isoform X3 [Clytia hemisphaerica]|uniref:Calponin-homology (CH) domain-containing protein n=1 Tax=Clytia hemisphaerica TaxID=252671 RepID=A0A7M5WY88_9CNID